MRMTDKHVSDLWINEKIKLYDFASSDRSNNKKKVACFMMLQALLELKHRRAEDRYREHKHGASNNA
jgi:hypothetical protein